jgi:hypothetical protein
MSPKKLLFGEPHRRRALDLVIRKASVSGFGILVPAPSSYGPTADGQA